MNLAWFCLFLLDLMPDFKAIRQEIRCPKCGRFTLTYREAAIPLLFYVALSNARPNQSHYNVCPIKDVNVITATPKFSAVS